MTLLAMAQFRKCIHALWVILIACAVGVIGCVRSDETWDRVRQAGVLRVGMDASFPPFEWISSDGTLTGLDSALARELGHRLGVEVQFVANLPYDGLYDALAIDRVDIVISALAVDPDRMADFIYSRAYFDAGQVLVVPCAESEIRELKDLEGRSVAVELGSQGDLEMRRWARRLQGVDVMRYDTAAEALAATATGVAMAAVSDRVSVMENDGPCLRIVGAPVATEPYAIAGRRNSARLIGAIDDVLADMQADGTLDALIDQYVRNR